MLGLIGDNLKGIVRKIKNSLFVDEALINDVVREIQRNLLRADVEVKLVLELSEKIKKRALEEKLPEGLDKREHLIKIIYEELVDILGGDKPYEFKFDKKPLIIMLVGLFGSGKTTTTGKLAKYFSKRGKKVLLVQTDTYRPAACEQLKQYTSHLNVKVLCWNKKLNLKDWFKEEVKSLKDNYDVILVDTAGRDALSDELIEELKQINDLFRPEHKFLVLNADIGQTAKKQAEAFRDAIGITGVIITKLDGSAKGGGALVAAHTTGAKIAFVGVGEKIDDLELFDAKKFIARLLGLGDLETLLEKISEVVDKEKAEELGKRFMKGEFTLIDLYEQMKSMQKLGPLDKILSFIPGLATMDLPKEVLETEQEKLKKWKYAMDSMTLEELNNPDIINLSRLERISKGSGVPKKEIKEMLKRYKESKKLMKEINDPKKIERLMKRFGHGKIKF